MERKESFKYLLYLIIIIFIIAIFASGSKELNIFYNTRTAQVIILVIGIILTIYFRYLGMLFLSAYLIGYLLRRVERFGPFNVVEADQKEIVQIDRDSLLYKLQNNEEDVTGVWSDSPLGKSMGLSKG